MYLETALRTRINELKLLKPGWLDGQGMPPDPTGLDWLADAFDAYYPDGAMPPCLFPTPEGRVAAEWSLEQWSPSLEIDLNTRLGKWHAVNLYTDQEVTEELDLSRATSLAWLASQICSMQLENNMRILPALVCKLCHSADGWVVGSGANPDTTNPRDWDILIPFASWPLAANLIPLDAEPNTFGGWRCLSEGKAVDVWPDDLSRFMLLQAEFVWHPRSGLRWRKI